jgi:broad specificity phosphatase PhoE
MLNGFVVSGDMAMRFKAIAMVTALVAGGILALSATGSAQEAIFVVRHSDPPPMLSLDEILDETPLSESGRQRAQMLAGLLEDAGISAIYASQTRRTVETAEPLAKALGVAIEVHSYDDVPGLIKRLHSDHVGERVLIVGHWSTIPPILKALGDPREVTIERSEYDNLFLVIPKEDRAPTVLHLHY